MKFKRRRASEPRSPSTWCISSSFTRISVSSYRLDAFAANWPVLDRILEMEGIAYVRKSPNSKERWKRKGNSTKAVCVLMEWQCLRGWRRAMRAARQRRRSKQRNFHESRESIDRTSNIIFFEQVFDDATSFTTHTTAVTIHIYLLKGYYFSVGNSTTCKCS